MFLGCAEGVEPFRQKHWDLGPAYLESTKEEEFILKNSLIL